MFGRRMRQTLSLPLAKTKCSHTFFFVAFFCVFMIDGVGSQLIYHDGICVRKIIALHQSFCLDNASEI